MNTSENCSESGCPPAKPKSEEECNHLGFSAKWVAGPWSEVFSPLDIKHHVTVIVDSALEHVVKVIVHEQ